MSKQYNTVNIDLSDGKLYFLSNNQENYISEFEYIQTVPFNVWTISHMQNSDKFIIKIFDNYNNEIVPDQITISDINTIVVTFTQNISGVAKLYFF